MTQTRATVRAVASAQALWGAPAAQLVIEAHLNSDAGGRCTGCGEIEPCPQRNLAHAALLGHGLLPQRRRAGPSPWTAGFGPDRSTFNAWGGQR